MPENPTTFVYKPTWVANTFILRGREERVGDIDPLKIQKLVYCFHGWHLATTGAPAVGEQFEAWPKGPVLSSLYHQFKHYRWNPISELATDVDPVSGQEEEFYVAPSDVRFYDVFNRVWNRYKDYNGRQLSALTHAEGTPWSKARQFSSHYIDNEDIREHFIELGRSGVAQRR